RADGLHDRGAPRIRRARRRRRQPAAEALLRKALMAHAQLEIIAAAFEAATHEMAASLVRTAFSPNIKERADCSTALCDTQGRALSLMTNAPAHLGSTLRMV